MGTKYQRLRFIIVLINLTFFTVFAQSQMLTGLVRDANGEGVPGVSVVEKGTINGTITNVKGEFEINVSQTNAILILSSVGYEKKEVATQGKKTLEIVLNEDVRDIDEVVVVGYGSTKKSDLTGAVSTVKVKKLKDTPANSIDQLLQGRSAGLQVINSSQDPGSGSTVLVRGASSINGSNTPLLVVDGFPIGEAGSLKQINPADIASVEVLKDASASAIYGSRGANGVILITTKKAKEGTSTVNIRQQTTLSQFTSELNIWRDAVLMAQLSNENRTNAGLNPLYIGETNTDGIYYPSVEEIQDGTWGTYTKWDDIVFRDLPISNSTTVSINSANERTSFNLSVNYFDEEGMYIQDDYKKGTVNLGVKHKVFDNFTISTSNIFYKGYRNSNGGLSYTRNPLWPVYNEDETYFLYSSTDYYHPLAITDYQQNETNSMDYISSWQADLQIFDCLNLKSQLNYKYGSYVTDKFYPSVYTEKGDYNNGYAEILNWLGQNVVSETYLTFDKDITSEHHLNVVAGHSYENYMQRNSNLYTYEFVNESLGNENMSAGDEQEHDNDLTKTKLLSFLGRMNYSFRNKYLLTLTFRADGSSKFGVNNKWAYFPSGAISWKAHEEEFIKQLDVFDVLKFRVSYGISGNQGISAYQTLSQYGTEEYYSNGNFTTAIGPGYVSGYEGDNSRFRIWSGIPNEDLKWETTSQYDIGFDMALLNKRIEVVFDYYVKNTSDLLRLKLLSLSSGYDKMWVNDGEIQNKGFECSINGDIVRNDDFDLSATLIYSRNRNEIVSLGNATSSGLTTDANTGMQYEFTGSSIEFFTSYANILAVGQPRNVFYGYKVDGIIQTEAEGLAAGLTGELAQPGEFKYVDINKDGTIDDDDRTIIGDPNPDFTLSLDLTARYKRFDFEIFFNGVFGNDVYYSNKWNFNASSAPFRWTQDNPTNDYPSLRSGRSYYCADWYVQDGSFLRIQTLNIGYNFNTDKIKRLSGLRLYANASNLYTFTKFDGYDPEVSTYGIYSGGYPRLRKWTFGLDITF